ncbi:MAG: hypothetical protein UV73_C0010G0008 [Candidatus Gottesmanbacteria bacterium GW2011_GWA2_43_14]|uniref:ABC transporter domain-containing protein n=1 Tax=Candidatus Gottesmanbacteria bacterium GW2011_GWA2_43_14 TaxID=1618443 RepID=A0A0G1GBW9_9BACT|nr:MAG: hypothetical protein UV73_C0010G0008 [Candidatus Gottesmanbacteria bacterium GW2011_GWA2_43_14]
MTSPVLEVKSVNKTYEITENKRLKVLDDVSLELKLNEIVAVVGPSACGKSTLLDCISGLSVVDQGQILLHKNPLNGRTGKVSYMMQDDVMLPWKNLKENIMLPYEVNGSTIPPEKTDFLIKLFGLRKFMGFYPGEVSGGTKQRASLLRAYVSGHEVLLLDEPFGKLDAITRHGILHWFLTIWQKKKLSVLLVTHDIDEALYLSDRIYVMSASPGKIISEIKVPFKRPRTDDYIATPQYSGLKLRLLNLIAG